MIAAMSSGSGKTTLTCALLKALSERGLKPEGFKCGPDYIDPMFQRRVLNIPCRNLDLFLQGREGVLNTLREQRGEIAVLEGAMGLFDGAGGTEKGSAYEVAALTGTPIVLVIKPAGIGLTLAAQIRGLQDFRKPDLMAGVILNQCHQGLYAYLKPLIEKECGLKVLGYLPSLPEGAFESRHLGLITADEIRDFDERMKVLAEALEKTVDVEAFLELSREVGEEEEKDDISSEERREASGGKASPLDKEKTSPVSKPKCRLAVARDEAFCFYYEENMTALRRAGAELVFFSPLRDEKVPEADGLYLGGGYPELHIPALSENISMMASLRRCVADGMPLVAECGGFLALQQKLGGRSMAGILPGEGFRTERLQRFGYVTLKAGEDSLLFRKGESIPAHEFHYWDCTENGRALEAEKLNGKKWQCAFCSPTLYAGFPHLHFGGSLPLAERFVEAAGAYHDGRKMESIRLSE